MDIHGKMVRITVFLLVVSMVTACTSATHLANPNRDQLLTQVSVGDRIAVYTKSGERHVFNIQAVDNEKIVSKKGTFRFDEIEKIEVKHVDRKKNAAWVIPVQMALVGLAIIVLQALWGQGPLSD